MPTTKTKIPDNHRIENWLQLALGILLIALLTYGLGPLGLRLPGMAAISEFIKIHDIEVTAIYYTEIEEFSQAEADLRNHLTYGPLGLQKELNPPRLR